MRSIAIVGPNCEQAAASLIRSLQKGGQRVTAAYVGPLAPHSDFVTSGGIFLPNDVFWLEWATGQPVCIGVPVAAEGETNIVLSVPDKGWSPTGQVELVDSDTMAFRLDRFGRPSALGHQVAKGAAYKIGVVGDPNYLQRTYPAVLARLGDAADQSKVTVKPVLIPTGATPSTFALDGLILPGGQDLKQVPSQISFAEHALNRGIPTLGLCLGMQSMTTAAVRASLWADAMLEEAAGPGPHRSFIRMELEDGSIRHRVGESYLRPASGTRLAAILPLGAAVRMNHRYCFNRDVDVTRLRQFALHWSGNILDAIEAKTHPFYIGLQGHPELGTDPALLDVWTAFVEAAIKSDHVGVAR